MKISRQALWQKSNPTRQRLIRARSASKSRLGLLKEGYVKTHEEIVDYIRGFERRNGEVSNETWWLIYEYIDWKYNNSKICGGYSHA